VKYAISEFSAVTDEPPITGHGLLIPPTPLSVSIYHKTFIDLENPLSF